MTRCQGDALPVDARSISAERTIKGGEGYAVKSKFKLSPPTQEKTMASGLSEKLENIGIDRLIEMIEDGKSTQKEIASALGVRSSAITRWVESDEGRKAAWKASELAKADELVSEIGCEIRKIEQGMDWALIKRVELLAAHNWKLAKVLASEKYGDKGLAQGVDFGRHGITININAVETEREEKVIEHDS